jgi:hypothetical protein
MKQLHLSVMLDVPDDLFKSAEALMTIKPAWETFLSALQNSSSSVKFDAASEWISTPSINGRPVAVTPTKRGRKPRVVVGAISFPASAPTLLTEDV